MASTAAPRVALWLLLGFASIVPLSLAGKSGQTLSRTNATASSLENAMRLEDTGRLQQSLAAYNAWLKSNPQDANALARRGGVFFKLGDNERALVDFDRSIAVEPRLTPYLWQRGISLYYAERWDDCLEQFVSHRAVNPNDVENAAWHFLCAARKHRVETAQNLLLPVGPDQRVPMSAVYQLYQGRAETTFVLDQARALERGPISHRLFYAHLYVALWHEAHGRPDQVLSHLRSAVEQTFPHYMGDVARVHLAWLEEALEAGQ